MNPDSIWQQVLKALDIAADKVFTVDMVMPTGDSVRHVFFRKDSIISFSRRQVSVNVPADIVDYAQEAFIVEAVMASMDDDVIGYMPRLRLYHRHDELTGMQLITATVTLLEALR